MGASPGSTLDGFVRFGVQLITSCCNEVLQARYLCQGQLRLEVEFVLVNRAVPSGVNTRTRTQIIYPHLIRTSTTYTYAVLTPLPPTERQKPSFDANIPR